LCSKWSPKIRQKRSEKSVSKSSPIQESLIPAVLKCPFAPLDKWPAEPLFCAEATLVGGTSRLLDEGRSRLLDEELYQSEEEVIGFLKAGKFKELPKSGEL
jgi:hypothetical protein